MLIKKLRLRREITVQGTQKLLNLDQILSQCAPQVASSIEFSLEIYLVANMLEGFK